MSIDPILLYSAHEKVTPGQLKNGEGLFGVDQGLEDEILKVENYMRENQIGGVVLGGDDYHYKFNLIKSKPYIVYYKKKPSSITTERPSNILLFSPRTKGVFLIFIDQHQSLLLLQYYPSLFHLLRHYQDSRLELKFELDIFVATLGILFAYLRFLFRYLLLR